MTVLTTVDEGRFASELTPPTTASVNWVLSIVLRVELIFVDRDDVQDGVFRDSNQTPFPLRNWRPEERREFARRFQYHCQRFWDNRFWLKTPDDFAELDWPPNRPTHRPNVWCRFRLEFAPSRVRPRVVHLLDDEQRVFRSNAFLYDHRDVEATSGRVTAIHEVGHLLGLRHTGEHHSSCVASSAQCYGLTSGERQNAMGAGMLFNPTNALPWRERVARHTRTRAQDWRAQIRHPAGHLRGEDAPRPLSALQLVDALVGQWGRTPRPHR